MLTRVALIACPPLARRARRQYKAAQPVTAQPTMPGLWTTATTAAVASDIAAAPDPFDIALSGDDEDDVEE